MEEACCRHAINCDGRAHDDAVPNSPKLEARVMENWDLSSNFTAFVPQIRV